VFVLFSATSFLCYDRRREGGEEEREKGKGGPTDVPALFYKPMQSAGRKRKERKRGGEEEGDGPGQPIRFMTSIRVFLKILAAEGEKKGGEKGRGKGKRVFPAGVPGVRAGVSLPFCTFLREKRQGSPPAWRRLSPSTPTPTLLTREKKGGEKKGKQKDWPGSSRAAFFVYLFL